MVPKTKSSTGTSKIFKAKSKIFAKTKCKAQDILNQRVEKCLFIFMLYIFSNFIAKQVKKIVPSCKYLDIHYLKLLKKKLS